MAIFHISFRLDIGSDPEIVTGEKAYRTLDEAKRDVIEAIEKFGQPDEGRQVLEFKLTSLP